MPMKTVYFVRHGETEANVARIIAGGELESPLTDQGKKQAKKAGQELRDKHIDMIVSSPMERTRDTAKLIAKEIGYDSENIVYDKNFIEVSNKFYSGKSYDLPAQHLKEGKLQPGLESSESVHCRVIAGLAKLRRLDAKNIVLVSHGATGRMVRAIAEDVPHHDFMSHKSIANAEIYRFSL